jgi:hypothetical protein
MNCLRELGRVVEEQMQREKSCGELRDILFGLKKEHVVERRVLIVNAK